MKYYAFNAILGGLLILFGAKLVVCRSHFFVVLRTSICVTIICLPWDFFGIKYATWSYEDPGLLVFDVPLNDLIFIFYCSFFTTAFLTQDQVKHIRVADKHTKNKKQEAAA